MDPTSTKGTYYLPQKNIMEDPKEAPTQAT
jgi:hypothetical protein